MSAPMNMEEWQRKLKVEKELARQKKSESAQILHGYRRAGDVQDDEMKLKLIRDEERKKALAAQELLHNYKGSGIVVGDGTSKASSSTSTNPTIPVPVNAGGYNIAPSNQDGVLESIVHGSVSERAAALAAAAAAATTTSTSTSNTKLQQQQAVPSTTAADVAVTVAPTLPSVVADDDDDDDDYGPTISATTTTTTTAGLVMTKEAPTDTTTTTTTTILSNDEDVDQHQQLQQLLQKQQPDPSVLSLIQDQSPPPQQQEEDVSSMMEVPNTPTPTITVREETVKPIEPFQASSEVEVQQQQQMSPTLEVKSETLPSSDMATNNLSIYTEKKEEDEDLYNNNNLAADVSYNHRIDLLLAFGLVTIQSLPIHNLQDYMIAMHQIITSISEEEDAKQQKPPRFRVDSTVPPNVKNVKWDESYVSRSGNDNIKRLVITVSVPIFVPSTTITRTSKSRLSQIKDLIATTLQTAIASGDLLLRVNNNNKN